MTNLRKRDANRQNASKSTGPKTELGKQRSARNAVRHGLSVSSLTDPCWAPEAIALACSLVSDNASPVLRELAYKFAAAQIDLVRVSLARHQIVTEMLTDEGFEPARQRKLREAVFANQRYLPQGSFERLMTALSGTPAGDEKTALVFCELTDKLIRLERYERRALSRRRHAMRAFSTVQHGECPDHVWA